VPAAASSSQTHRSKTKRPVPSFSRIAPASRRGFIPSKKRIGEIPYRLRRLIRATRFARASAPSTQFTRPALQLATTCAASPAQHPIACRTRGAQLHFVPPASGWRLCVGLGNYVTDGIHPLRRRIAPIPYRLRILIRATCFARQARSSPDRREPQFSSLPFALARNCTSYRWPPAGTLHLTLQPRQRGDSSPP